MTTVGMNVQACSGFPPVYQVELIAGILPCETSEIRSFRANRAGVLTVQIGDGVYALLGGFVEQGSSGVGLVVTLQHQVGVLEVASCPRKVELGPATLRTVVIGLRHRVRIG